MFSLDHYDFGTPASEGTEPVTLEIDGRAVTVPAGTSVMRAAAIAAEGEDIQIGRPSLVLRSRNSARPIR